MNRFHLVIASIPVFGLAVAGCGSSDDTADGTLPTIYTTTSTTTTTTTPDQRRRFYEVEPGDNLAIIAREFEVPAREIVRLNNLVDNGEILQVGDLLEIPTDVVLVEKPVAADESSDDSETDE